VQSGDQRQPKILRERGGDRVTDLVGDGYPVPKENEIVWKSLKSGGLTHGYVPVLKWMREAAARKAIAFRGNRAGGQVPRESSINGAVSRSVDSNRMARQPQRRRYVGPAAALWDVRNAQAVELRDVA
jgi:hypothetical protein